MNSKVKYLELESLRGLAAVMVIFFHIPNFNKILDFNFFKNLELMVDLFFVLSGFVIYSAYGEKLKTGKELIKFQFLRFGRLYPIHIIFLIIFFLFEVARYVMNVTGHSFANSAPFEKNNITAFIDHLLLIQTLHPDNAKTFNRVAWSISAEFYTYILFGLIVLYLRRYMNYVFFVITLVSIFTLFYGVGSSASLIFRCTAGFFIGCLTAKMLKESKQVCASYVSYLIFFLLIGFIAFNESDTYDSLIYLISAALIFGLVSNPKGALNSALNNKILVYLGTISYSMYMSHVSILYITNYLVKIYRAPSFQSKDGQMIPYLNIFELSIYVVLSLALIFLISHLLYQYVEKPFRTRSRELSDTLKVMN